VSAGRQDEWSGVRLFDLLDRAAAADPERERYVFEDRGIGAGDAARESADLAKGLAARGLRRGDRVAIWMTGRSEWVATYFGLARLGVVMVPLNTRLRPAEFRQMLERVEPAAVIVEADAAGRREIEWADGAALAVAVGGGGPAAFEEILAAGAGIADAELEPLADAVRGDDPALVQYTSGTEGLPKGATLRQEGMVRGGFQVGERVELGPEDRFFNPQPFFHVGGSILIMLAPLHFGCTVLTHSQFDPGRALAAIEAERCTVTIGHQPHWIEYLADPSLAGRDLVLRKAVSLADPATNRRVSEELGIAVICPYGMSETHLVGTSTWLGDPLEARIETVGTPHPGVELSLLDPDDGEPVGPGDVGEVCLAGWCVMDGYAGDPERTAATVDSAGRLHTGDLGHLDADGRLRLAGRLKETIRVGGENVAALEVETFLLAIEGVKQAVVVGRADPRLGEVPVAFVQLRPEAALDPVALAAACREGLAAFKAPREIRLVTEWPLSGTGKIRKGVLRERAATPSSERSSHATGRA
jgi:acyl-CoA synthetase (AMP-forming)/AMP-acid ligase II